MKKFVSIALAIVMMLSVSVCAFADDYVDSIASEVLSEHKVLFPTTGWWNEDAELNSDEDDGIAFAEAVQTEGAKVVVIADAAVGSGEDGDGYQYGIQLHTGSWKSVVCHFNWENESSDTMVYLAPEEVVVEGDYCYVIFDAGEFVAALEAEEIDWSSWQWVYGSGNDTKTYYVDVILPASAESAEETEESSEEASSETSETTEASESTETSTASSPDTGVALALVPMAIAGIAVVSSKRR